MQSVTEPGRTTVTQSRPDILAPPVFIVVILLAVVIRQFIPPHPSPVILGVCGAVALLDIAFAGYIQRNGAATLIVTPDLITVERTGNTLNNTRPRTMQRTPETTLTFRLQSNGVIPGGQFTYLLKLRDTATNNELAVNAFGRRKVRQACESQGWRFAVR